jgi:ribosome-binding ATPase
MALQIGIVGLPNVGKSTLFRAITKKQVEAANYPFTTIDPNVGVVEVPDDRLAQLAALEHSKKVIPAVIEFVDIAGLVRGAHKGEGLGNQFLHNIQEVDAIVHVVRVFEDGDIQHVDQHIDPMRDIDTINTELILRDLQVLEKILDRARKDSKSGDKYLTQKVVILEKLFQVLNEQQFVSTVFGELSEDDRELIKDVPFITSKPVLYAFNVAEDQVANPTLPDALQALPHVTVSAKIESELAELDAEDAKIYMQDLGITESGLSRLIKEGYALLNLITYFTAGEKESKAWTIVNGTTAPGAAGVIHSDFERGFISADVIHWKDLIDSGSWPVAKEKGLVRGEGKEYVVQDGDVMIFKFSV